jgi:sigma-E factor negative regulatory protein RseA
MNEESIREKLSALVDDELDEFEERRMHAALANDAGLRRTWERYYLVRAALHQELEIVLPPTVAERVAQRIAGEPSEAGSYWRHRLVRLAATLAMAASVAAIAVLGVQRVSAPPGAPETLAAAGPDAALPVVRVGTTRWDTKEPQAEEALNAYLIEHNEFAADLGGMMPSYVRVVGYDSDK